MSTGNVTGKAAQAVYTEKTTPTSVDQSSETAFDPKTVTLSPSETRSEQSRVEDKAEETLENAHISSDTAEKSGIKLKNREFYKTLAVAVGSGVLLGAGFIATVATAGAATPLLLLAATNMTVAVGDAVCAYKDLNGNNRNLPMGSDSVGNVMYAVLKRAGVDSDKSLKVADRVSMFGRGLFALATISSCQKLGHRVKNFATQVAKEIKIENKKQQTLAKNFTSVKMSDLNAKADEKSELDALGIDRSKAEREAQLAEISEMEKEAKASYEKSIEAFASMRSDWRTRYEESVGYDKQKNGISFKNVSKHEFIENKETETENQQQTVTTSEEKKIKPKQKAFEQSSLEDKLQHKQKVLKGVKQREYNLIKKRGRELLKDGLKFKTVEVRNKKGVESFERRVAEHQDIVSFLTDHEDPEYVSVKDLQKELAAEITEYEQNLKKFEAGGKKMPELSSLGQLYNTLSSA
ncbi:hypothetical protein D5R81_01100 [Parashewanella spongiae]|uniref:Uncharacterized protein n=1 Tax=Parashewanella spongiae TaxID=342950 RepID=A0A3A6U556_9GAMM|nr:hypothetical protein [Parashewanella spongiae]MCL1077178.1 hypothetical protein [Parashewanella spongiae]RJY19333.1 hypothetical protein D5R81_01100 [Parashewanella spongiae]